MWSRATVKTDLLWEPSLRLPHSGYTTISGSLSECGDDPRKRMRLTADRQTRVSEATTGEPINDTLLDALELDLSGPRRTGSDDPEGKVGINATPVDSDEEPLVSFAATQQDAFVLCAESHSAVVDQDLGSIELDVPGVVHGRDVRPRRGSFEDTGRQHFAARTRASPCSSVQESSVGASILWVHSTIQTRHWAQWFSCRHSQFQFSWESEEGHGGTPWNTSRSDGGCRTRCHESRAGQSNHGGLDGVGFCQ